MALAVKGAVPCSREGVVPRSRLLRALHRRGAPRIVLLSAPAGYGKTTLLSEWAMQASEPTAWLALEPWHDHPLALARALVERLSALEPFEVDPLAGVEAPEDALAAAGGSEHDRVLPALAGAMRSRQLPFALVLDDVQHLICAESLSVLASLAEHLPCTGRLALASRTRPALPLGRLRANRELVELDARDLALSSAEAAMLLEYSGLTLASDQIEWLTARTEGWPAALYLAALGLREAPNSEAALASFSGAGELVAEYVREEFLGALAEDELDLLVRGSVCELLTPRLCDALRERGGSARLLEGLVRGPLPFEAVDAPHESYRAHPLVRDVLRRELRHAGLSQERQAHRRACAWHASCGEIDAAISHAIAAEDLGTVGALMWEHLSAYVPVGRNNALQTHLRRLSDEQIAGSATLAASAAHSALTLGRLRAAERYARSAAAALSREGRPATDSLRAGIMAIELAAVRGGILPLAREAERAHRGADAHSPWQPTFSLLRGVYAHLSGERRRAREQLEAGIHDGVLAAPTIEMLCLSQLALVSAEEGDLEAALVEISAAGTQVERHSLLDYPIAALCFAVSADLHSQAAAPERARLDAQRARRLLAQLGEFIPWYCAESQIALARAELRLGEPPSARRLLAQASRLARRLPDACTLVAWLQEAWAAVDSAAASAISGSASLTLAELRVLRFLPTHLSFREIAERLHVSTNTVKTQAHSVYRKLDARSRSQAVERAGRIGLLDR